MTDAERDLEMAAHHPWCNYFMLPPAGCSMCAKLRSRYPDNEPPDEMLKRHFPEAIPVRTDHRNP